MAKVKTVYFCRNCGAESSKWIGRCPSCGEWNTYIEEKVAPVTSSRTISAKRNQSAALPLDKIEPGKMKRVSSSLGEIDRLLGGGFVPGSLLLFGGEPGIGKSTLALQIALGITGKVLYVSGEESPEQIKMRAERLHHKNSDCYIFSEVNLESIITQFENEKPDLLILDSIQTLYTDALDASPGSISQIRECAAQLLKLAKTTHVPTILIGHITKDGTLAGPKLLEHIVDTVLQFEGDHQNIYRVLRALKNRFGSTAEIAIFEMEADGLHEITNPSEIFLNRDSSPSSGVAIASAIDGTRPFLIEVQALVSSAVYGTPQRTATGFDNRRLNMLLAVLERKAGFKLATKDVFLNIAGGFRVQDPATDLAIVCAILSSTFDRPVDNQLCMAAELSLTGELKAVTRIDQRIDEAARLGFKKILIPRLKKAPARQNGITVVPCSRIEDAIKLVFRNQDAGNSYSS
ncbi:MAG: DNA repair protein RadA [Bacteroidales bacterium]|nr:DNA repair protein RadA [Bacteroidales bacterium]